MTGVGVRGIRYIQEVENISEILFNDINPIALEFTKHNIHLNKVDSKAKTLQDDANRTLSLHASTNLRFDIVDLDPFGSPASFLDSAIRATHIGGLLAATATDMAVLCGVHRLAAKRKYGVTVFSTDYSKETALRILLSSIIKVAAISNIAVKPLFCYSSDHYIRVHTLIYMKKDAVRNLLNQIGFVIHCLRCLYRESISTLQDFAKKCPRCRSKLKLIGPLWLGSLFDREYCKKMIHLYPSTLISERHRVKKILDIAVEEATMPPLFYSLTALCDKLNLTQPKLCTILEQLRHQGFRATRSHIYGNAVKTDAPLNVLETLLKS
jgi:tRNA (guanine26-N2/guanine27-N2)-dimethyltransferase